jgi:hypothetical protein
MHTQLLPYPVYRLQYTQMVYRILSSPRRKMRWVHIPTPIPTTSSSIAYVSRMDVAADRPGVSLSAGYDDIRHQP